MPQRSSYSKGVGYNALNFVLVAVLGVGTAVVTARLYGARVLGEFALVTATSNAVMVLSSARERPALVREIAHLPARAPRLSALWLAVFSFSVVLSLTVGLLFTGGTYLLFNGPVDHPELFLAAVVSIAAYVVLDNTNVQVETIFTVFRSGALLFRVRTFQAVSLAALSIGLGIVEPTLWSLIAAQALSSAASLVWRLVALRRYVDVRVPRAELRDAYRTLPEVIRFGLKIAPGSMADGVSNQAGTWILGSIASLSVVGAYNRAWQLARSVLLFNNRITEMLFPTLIERHREGDRAGFDRVLVDTLRYSGAAMFVLGSVFGGAAVGVMSLFGEDFVGGAEVLPWLLSVPGLLTLSMVQRHALYVFNEPLRATASAFGRMLVTVGATVPLTLWLGIAGPGVALCLGLLIDVAYTTSRVAPRLSRPLRELWPRRQRAGLAAAFAGGYLVAQEIDGLLPGVLGAVAGVPVGTVAYVATLLVVGGLTPTDLTRARGAMAALRRRAPGRLRTA